jgi:hypothetical protein
MTGIGEKETGRGGRLLLMEVLHGGSAENNEESHPEGGTLEGDHLIGFAFFRLVISFENHCIEEERQQTQHEKELDEKDREVFGVMLDARAGL